MESRLASFLSYILHPLLVPTYCMLVLLNLPLFLSFTLSLEAKAWLISLVFAFTFIAPVAIILTLYFFRMVDSIELEKPSQRTLPLIFTSLSYMGLLYILRSTSLPDYLLYMIYGALFTLLAGMLINLFYKISLHTLAWGAAVASFAGLAMKMGVELLPVIIAGLLLSGITGFARLKLNAHNPPQVYLGFIVGVIIISLITFTL